MSFDLSVESLCNQLARNRLLAAEEIRAMHRRWRSEAGQGASDFLAFSRWLIANEYVTEFQHGLVVRGFGDMLFVNDYKLIDRIGQGRMAGVYKAVHPTTGQVVAIKVLPPSKARHPQLLARFRREARLAERLDHDNVVRTFQCGESRAGLYYIVMEHLDGETLADVLERRGRLPIPEAVGVAIQALEGLQHLHDEGIVHRDMKPANLMLVPSSPPGEARPGRLDTTLAATVKILDIGLSRALFDEGSPDDPHELTADGVLLGTPNYLAPEQARSAHAADIRADIYGLGCILYEMLTGQTPFADSNLARQIMRHAKETPRPVRQLNPAVPEALNHLVLTMLAKDPAMRFALPSQAAKALRELVHPPPSSPSRRPLKSYLTWLQSQAKPDDPLLRAPGPADKEPLPMPVWPPARPAGAAVAVAAPAAVQPPPASVARPEPMRAVPAVAAPAYVPINVPTPVPARIPASVAGQAPSSPPAAVKAETPPPALAQWLERRLFLGLTGRDVLAAAFGMMFLLVVELIFLILSRLL